MRLRCLGLLFVVLHLRALVCLYGVVLCVRKSVGCCRTFAVDLLLMLMRLSTAASFRCWCNDLPANISTQSAKYGRVFAVQSLISLTTCACVCACVFCLFHPDCICACEHRTRRSVYSSSGNVTGCSAGLFKTLSVQTSHCPFAGVQEVVQLLRSTDHALVLLCLELVHLVLKHVPGVRTLFFLCVRCAKLVRRVCMRVCVSVSHRSPWVPLPRAVWSRCCRTCRCQASTACAASLMTCSNNTFCWRYRHATRPLHLHHAH